MKNKSLVESGCLLLLLVAQLGFLKAEETTTVINEAVTEETVLLRKVDQATINEREELYKKTYEEKMKAYEQLEVDKNAMLHKLKDLIENPKPLPNILEMINKENDVISLKIAFEEIWPKFWKVPRRKQCAKLFEQKTEKLIQEVTEKIRNDYNELLSNLRSYLRKDDYDLEEEKEELEIDYARHLKPCGESGLDWFCDIRTGTLEYSTKHFRHAEDVVNDLDNTMIRSVLDELNNKIRASLINPVRACLNQ